MSATMWSNLGTWLASTAALMLLLGGSRLAAHTAAIALVATIVFFIAERRADATAWGGAIGPRLAQVFCLVVAVLSLLRLPAESALFRFLGAWVPIIH